MNNKLMIVESPTKIKKIRKILGPDWNIKASVGHVADLAAKQGIDGLGFNVVENKFKPIYEISKDKEKVVRNLKHACKAADEVYLATDPDREGEAIALHLKNFLKLKKYKRITFNEINETAINNAIKNVRDIDMGYCDAQETRRLLDRIFGFKFSNSVRTHDPKIKSIGRVQTAALKIIANRYQEIENFVPKKYKQTVLYIDGKKYVPSSVAGKKIEKLSDIDEKLSAIILKSIEPKELKVKSIEINDVAKIGAKPMATTDVLIMGSQLKLKAVDVTRCLKELFEKGYITYPRTDMNIFSNDFIESAKKYFLENEIEFNNNYKNPKSKAGAQEAHESIRPTELNIIPTDVSTKALELYKKIKSETIVSLMPAKIDEVTKVTLVTTDGAVELTANYKTNKIPGYMKFTQEKIKDEACKYKIDDHVNDFELVSKDKSTKPPSLYSQGELIKYLEKSGVGRPSTYSSILTTIFNRSYVFESGNKISPTELGLKLIKFTDANLAEYINEEFTKNMELKLDEIAKENSAEDKDKVLGTFFDDVNKLTKKIDSKVLDNLKTCPKCKIGKIVKRTGKHGEFEACNNFPKCKYIVSSGKRR